MPLTPILVPGLLLLGGIFFGSLPGIVRVIMNGRMSVAQSHAEEARYQFMAKKIDALMYGSGVTIEDLREIGAVKD